MTAYLHARLIGGPFDGDEGTISYDELPYGARIEPPPSLWAWHCSNPRCPADGSHWSPIQEEAEAPAVRYDLVEDAEDQLHVYAYGEALDPSLREEAEEMALA